MSLILIGFFITISLALIGINLQILHKALDKVNLEYSTGNDKLFSHQDRIRKWCFFNIVGFISGLIISIIELTFFSIYSSSSVLIFVVLIIIIVFIISFLLLVYYYY